MVVVTLVSMFGLCKLPGFLLPLLSWYVLVHMYYIWCSLDPTSSGCFDRADKFRYIEVRNGS